jgi:hypothetical protein
LSLLANRKLVLIVAILAPLLFANALSLATPIYVLNKGAPINQQVDQPSFSDSVIWERQFSLRDYATYSDYTPTVTLPAHSFTPIQETFNATSSTAANQKYWSLPLTGNSNVTWAFSLQNENPSDYYSSPYVTAETYCTKATDNATVGTLTWTNPNNAKANDSSVAYFGYAAGTSHYLKLNTTLISLPANATITSIQAYIKHQARASNTYKDVTVKLMKDGNPAGTNKAQNGTWWTFNVYEVYTYTWTASELGGITVAQVNSNLFGLVLSASSVGGTTYGWVDVMSIRIYYTVPYASYARTDRVILFLGDLANGYQDNYQWFARLGFSFAANHSATSFRVMTYQNPTTSLSLYSSAFTINATQKYIFTYLYVNQSKFNLLLFNNLNKSLVYLNLTLTAPSSYDYRTIDRGGFGLYCNSTLAKCSLTIYSLEQVNLFSTSFKNYATTPYATITRNGLRETDLIWASGLGSNYYIRNWANSSLVKGGYASYLLRYIPVFTDYVFFNNTFYNEYGQQIFKLQMQMYHYTTLGPPVRYWCDCEFVLFDAAGNRLLSQNATWGFGTAQPDFAFSLWQDIKFYVEGTKLILEYRDGWLLYESTLSPPQWVIHQRYQAIYEEVSSFTDISVKQELGEHGTLTSINIAFYYSNYIFTQTQTDISGGTIRDSLVGVTYFGTDVTMGATPITMDQYSVIWGKQWADNFNKAWKQWADLTQPLSNALENLLGPLMEQIAGIVNFFASLGTLITSGDIFTAIGSLIGYFVAAFANFISVISTVVLAIPSMVAAFVSFVDLAVGYMATLVVLLINMLILFLPWISIILVLLLAGMISECVHQASIKPFWDLIMKMIEMLRFFMDLVIQVIRILVHFVQTLINIV